jgi:hypothetical protein
MVFGTHKAMTSMGTINTGRRRHISGRGMGSVLLDGGLGGSGAGSSYSSVDDYINTTHSNPYTHQPVSMSGGGLAKRSLSTMNKKIEGLLVKRGKEKNINFNI